MKTTKRLFALLLALLMVASLFPATALATEAEEAPAPEVYEAPTVYEAPEVDLYVETPEVYEAPEAYYEAPEAFMSPEAFTTTPESLLLSPEAHSAAVPSRLNIPNPLPWAVTRRVSHWWPSLSIDVGVSLLPPWITIDIDCQKNMFLHLTELHALSLLPGPQEMVIYVENDIIMPSIAPPAAVPIGSTLRIIGVGNQPPTIFNQGFTEHFIVPPGATLILENIILCGGDARLPFLNHHGGVRVDGAVFAVGTLRQGRLFMGDGAVIQNSHAVGSNLFRSRGGGVYLTCGGLLGWGGIFNQRQGGELIMHPGSEIRNNHATRGAGVYASFNASVYMVGGRIHNNEARSIGNVFNAYNTGTGGGVHISENATLTMWPGSSIDNNTALYGGGVRLRGANRYNRAEFIMHGGEIHSNTATRSTLLSLPPARGGGVRLCANSDFYMHGGTIRDNRVDGFDGAGGGVSVGYHSPLSTPGMLAVANRGARLTMTGGTITGNQANTGGGVRISAGAALELGFRAPSMYMTGGTVSNNRAHEGAGVWTQANSVFHMGRDLLGQIFNRGVVPEITGNTAARRGGGLFVGAFADTYIAEGRFTGNHAGQDGGAIFAQRFAYVPVLLPLCYPDLNILNRTHFSGNTAGRGEWRNPVNASTFNMIRFPNSASTSGTRQRHALNNIDVNYLGNGRLVGPTPDFATVYFLWNDGRVNDIFDQDFVELPGTVAEPTETPLRDGFRFDGWSLDPEGNEMFDFDTVLTTDHPNMVRTRGDWVSTGFWPWQGHYEYHYHLNLYAQWTERHPIHFIGNGGNPAFRTIEVYEDTTTREAIQMWRELWMEDPLNNPARFPWVDEADFPLENPVREGWEFLGWALNEFYVDEPAILCDNEELLDELVLSTNQRRVFYAQWRPVDPPPEPMRFVFIGNLGVPGEILVEIYEDEVEGDLLYSHVFARWEEQWLEHELNVNQMLVPYRTGFTFLHWSYSTVEGDDFVNPNSIVGQNRLFFAQWEPIPQPSTITFMGNGGFPVRTDVVVQPEDMPITLGDAVQQWRYATGQMEPLRATPDGEPGYIFLGWSRLPQGGEIIDSESPILEDTRLYAQWRQETVQRVAFNATGGTPASVMVTLIGDNATYGDAIARWQELTEVEEPTREGYIFLGWSRMEDGQNHIVVPDQTFTGNIWLQAQWQRVDIINIFFNATGGTPAGVVTTFTNVDGETPFLVTYGEAIAQWEDAWLEDPANVNGMRVPYRTGYTFVGWSLREDGGTYLVAPMAQTRESVQLFAQWEALPSINVTFNGNGGMPGTQTMTVPSASTTYAYALHLLETYGEQPVRPGFMFTGWAYDVAGNFPINPNLVRHTDVTLFAQWRAVIEVGFWGNGGTPVEQVARTEAASTTYGAMFAQVEEPTRAGHTFVGWARATTDGARLVHPEETLTESSWLFAMWEEVVPYRLTFHGNGGTPIHTTVEIDRTVWPNATYGVAILHRDIVAWHQQPTREGHTFAGWSLLPQGSLVNPFMPINPGFVNLYAQWIADEAPVTVTFLGNGGRPVFEQVTIDRTVTPNPTYGQAHAQRQGGVPTRPGYVFTYWSRYEDGPAVDPARVVDTVNPVLFAQWRAVEPEPQPIFLSFISSPGQPGYQAVEIQEDYSFNQAIARATVPTRTGYNFAGWAIEPVGTPLTALERAQRISNFVLEPFALFAQWTPISQNCNCGDQAGCNCGATCGCDANCDCAADPTQIRVTFIGNQGIPGHIVVYVDAGTFYGTAINRWTTQTHMDVPTREGYTFLGWSRVSTANGTIVTNTSLINNDTLLFAQWSRDIPDPITITFHGNSGTPVQEIVTMPRGTTYGAAITEWQAQTLLTVPAREGHTFLGWSRAATGGAIVTDASTINADIDLYAQWQADQPDTVNVTFNGNGGTPGQTVVNVTLPATYNTAIAAWQTQTGLTAPTRTGFTFAGWSRTQTGTPVAGGSALTANATLYAQWTTDVPPTVNVTFSGNGGAPGQTVVTVTLPATYNTAIAAWQAQTGLTAPTREGFTFGGWSRTQTGTPVAGGSALTANVTLFAQWNAVIPDCPNCNGVGNCQANCDCDRECGRPGCSCEIAVPTFTVYFRGNGGQPTDKYITVESGTTFGVAIARWQELASVTAPTREGFIFEGWSRQSAAGGAIVSNTAGIDQTLALFAQWRAVDGPIPDDPIRVLFSSNGGSPASRAVYFETTSTTFGIAIAEWQAQTGLAAPVREGFTFRGWSLVSTEGGALVNEAGVIIADIAVYAQWTVAAPPPDCECGPAAPGCECGTLPEGCSCGTLPDGCDCGPAPECGCDDLCGCDEFCECDDTCECTDIVRLHPAYMFGDNYGNFRAAASITRAEVATILARTQALDFERGVRRLPPGMTTFTAFSDVRQGDWFFFYVAWAYDMGLIQGFEGRFRPNEPVTREELAAMITRLGIVQEAGTLGFLDAGDVSAWARRYVYTAYREGLMVGNQNGEFHPRRSITRAEVATVVNRQLARVDSVAAWNAISEVEGEADITYFPDLRTAAWYWPVVVAATNDHLVTRNEVGGINWKQILP